MGLSQRAWMPGPDLPGSLLPGCSERLRSGDNSRQACGKFRCPGAPMPCCLQNRHDRGGMGPRGQQGLRADPSPPGTVLGCPLGSREESSPASPHRPCPIGAPRPCHQSASPGERTTRQQEGPCTGHTDAAQASAGPLSSEGFTQVAGLLPSCHTQAASCFWADSRPCSGSDALGAAWGADQPPAACASRGLCPPSEVRVPGGIRGTVCRMMAAFPQSSGSGTTPILHSFPW